MSPLLLRSLVCCCLCLAVTVTLWTGSLSAFEDPVAMIARKCARDWPSNARMRAACVEQQTAIFDKSRSSPVNPRIPIEDLTLIREKCAKDMPDDFRMQARCEQQQLQGLKKLRIPPPRGITLKDYSVSVVACAKEWPDDFRQRAHCVDTQLAASRRHENFGPLDHK